ncbi:MAG: AI-2E family transporter [Bacteroidetes bacterium QS_8_68_15]|nr:MAG: AI-2E family transporter [Bacteroidetes bacterium QS_8_68_15]
MERSSSAAGSAPARRRRRADGDDDGMAAPGGDGGDARAESAAASTVPPSVAPMRADNKQGASTWERVVRFALGALALAGAAWALWYFAGLVVYLVIGGLLAYLMRPVVHRVQGLGVGRLPAIGIVFVGVFGVLAVLVGTLAPFAVRQATDLSQQVSVNAISSVVQTLEARLLNEMPFLEEGFLVESLREIANTLFRDDRLQQTFSSAFGLLTDVVYAVVVVPFVTFFFLKDGTRLRHSLLHWVPNRYFEVTLAILDKVESSLGRYLRALFVQCTAVGIVASLLLSLTGLNYAVAVGIFAGLANSIPYFGPAVGFIAGSLVGVAQTGNFALITPIFVAMVLTQLSDNLIFQPFIFSRAAQAHPLVILFVVLIGAQLAGIVGMLVAIPVTTVLQVVFSEVFWSIRHYRILQA